MWEKKQKGEKGKNKRQNNMECYRFSPVGFHFSVEVCVTLLWGGVVWEKLHIGAQFLHYFIGLPNGNYGEGTANMYCKCCHKDWEQHAHCLFNPQKVHSVVYGQCLYFYDDIR